MYARLISNLPVKRCPAQNPLEALYPTVAFHSG